MKKSKAVKISLGIIFIFFLIYAATLVIPMLYLVGNSFKSNGEFLDTPWSLPKNWKFENYIDAFSMKSGNVTLSGMFINSIILSFASTLISVTSVTVTAYVLARFSFTGRNFLVTFAIISMFLPDLGSGASLYKLFVSTGLVNTWGILLKYGIPFGFTFLLMYSYFKGISHSYTEAARIDGAGEWLIFFSIILPMAKAALGVIIFMGIVGSWNDYLTPYMYLPEVKTLATGLQGLSFSAATTGAYTQMFAAMVIGTAPLIILFISMRETIINNTVTGGLKG